MYQLLSLPVCPLDSHNIALSHCFSACSEDALNPPCIITFATRSHRHAFVTNVGCANLLRSFQPVAPLQRNCHLHSGVMPSRIARVSSLPHQIHTTSHHRRRIVAGLCYDLSCNTPGVFSSRACFFSTLVARASFPVLPFSVQPAPHSRDSPPAFSPRATLRVYNAITYPH